MHTMQEASKSLLSFLWADELTECASSKDAQVSRDDSLWIAASAFVSLSQSCIDRVKEA